MRALFVFPVLATASVFHNMRALVVFATASVLATASAVPRDPQRIVGGNDTLIERYPFMANMQYLWDGAFWWTSCGGALITTTSILSAAHCYEDDFTWEWRVRLGSTSMSGGTIHAISAFVLHEQYNLTSRLDHDVAIVRLAVPAVLSASVGVARIGGANYILPDNTPVIAVGWGELWDFGPQPETLQHVTVYTINQEICAERYTMLKTLPRYRNWPDVTSNMLCSGVLNVGGRDSCAGDSGGPVLHNGDIIVGITSWGYECAHSFFPGVNARVSNYVNWIVNNA